MLFITVLVCYLMVNKVEYNNKYYYLFADNNRKYMRENAQTAGWKGPQDIGNRP